MEHTAVRVFGSPESQSVLGKHTLDAFGLSVDEYAGKLMSGLIYLR